MILIEKEFPTKCKDCIFWKRQTCILMEVEVSYEDSNEKRKDCCLKEVTKVN